jgi:hypothetical protein
VSPAVPWIGFGLLPLGVGGLGGGPSFHVTWSRVEVAAPVAPGDGGLLVA